MNENVSVVNIALIQHNLEFAQHRANPIFGFEAIIRARENLHGLLFGEALYAFHLSHLDVRKANGADGHGGTGRGSGDAAWARCRSARGGHLLPSECQACAL